MSNWHFVKKDRINIVKGMYKEYKKYGTPNKGKCNDYCVTVSCKKGEFRDYMNNKCMHSNSTCVDCWKEFFEFLDIKVKRNNLEAYDNAE